MQKGLTLIELLIVIGILVLIGTVGIVSLSGYRSRQDLDLSARRIVNALRDAQQRAITQEAESQWGIRFQGVDSGKDLFHLFSGPSFTAATSTYDLPPTIEFADLGGNKTLDVVFSKLTGLPTSTAEVKIRLAGDTSVTQTISVSSAGRVSY